MARKSHPKDELADLEKQQNALRARIKEAEKKLHLRLGKLVCDAGADTLSDDALKAVLVAAVKRVEDETGPAEGTALARKQPPATPAAD